MTSKAIAIAALSLGLSCTTTDTSPIDSVGAARPSIDSETHFLSYCADGCAEGLRCVCGVCTLVCDEQTDCAALGEVVDCVPPTPANPESCALTRVRTVCDAPCTADADCSELGARFVCAVGACRQAPPADETCGDVMTPACAEDEQIETRFDEGGCATLACVPLGICRQHYSGSIELGCTDPAQEQYWFNSATGRCELHGEGHCPTSENSFDSLLECGAACGAGGGGQCFEAWNASWETAEIEPVASNGLPLDPATITRESALALVDKEYTALLTYPDGAQTELTITTNNTAAYHVTRTENPNGPSLAIVLLGPTCPATIAVETDVHFATADGRFDEHWQRVPFTVNAWDAFAGVDLWVEGDWWPARGTEEALLGSYRPAIGAEACSLGSDLSLRLLPGSVSGGVRHTVVDLPCDQVSENTGISQPTPTTGTPPAVAAPVPVGPVWSSVVREVNGQFCTYASPNGRGPEAPADTRAVDNLDDPQPDDRLAAAVTAECLAEGGAECAPGAFITLWAAECIARAEGLEVGIRAWDTVLGYVEEAGRVQWTVSTTLTDDGAGVRSGKAMSIDAITAEVLATSPWTAEP